MILVSFPSRTNLKLHVSVTPKMVEKVIANLHSSKASGLNYIPMVVIKNFKLELLYILAEIFNICLKESRFSRFLKGLIGGPCV